MSELKKGDAVEWNTPQGPTHGSVTRKVTGQAHAGGHTAKAMPQQSRYEVKSDPSCRKAVHKADALRKA